MKHKNGIRERKRNHKIMITIGITLDIKEDPSIPSLTLQSQPLATIQGKVKSTIKVNPIKVWSQKNGVWVIIYVREKRIWMYYTLHMQVGGLFFC